MAPQAQAAAVSALRAVSFRISSASKAELPHVVACVSQNLSGCKDLLSSPDNANAKDSDAAIVLHRFNTQVSSLLQDRTVEGRWAAIVLVKAAIEAGGWETLRKSNGWVRNLLAMLKKPDPPLTRCLCMLTLTRIFMLTWDYPTLIREMTTPALPTFVATCLSNAAAAARPGSQDELRTTLECFSQLIPRHPTIFRNHHAAVDKLLASCATGPEDIQDRARVVAVLMHQCEPKGGAAEKLQAGMRETVRLAHGAADRTFISVEEDWPATEKHALGPAYGRAQESKAASEKPVQQFIVSGSEALTHNLRQLTAYFSVATPASINVPIGLVTDLLARLFAISISAQPSRTSARFTTGTSRDEKDALAQALPAIHVAAIELLSAILSRYGSAIAPATQSFLDQLLWIFPAASANTSARTGIYTTARQILTLIGPSCSKQTTLSLRKLIQSCCADLLPTSPTTDAASQPQAPANGSSAAGANKQKQSTMNADAFLKPAAAAASSSPTSAPATALPALHEAAALLLPTLLSSLPSAHIPPALRATLDRTAVLTAHKSGMLASVLNPAAVPGAADVRGGSVLPLLVRGFGSDEAVEGVLRPRMPVIVTGRRMVAGGDAVEDEEEEEEEEEEEGSESGDDEDMDDVAADEHGDAAESAEAGADTNAAATAASTAEKKLQIEQTWRPSVTATAPAAERKRARSSSPDAAAAASVEKRQRATPVAEEAAEARAQEQEQEQEGVSDDDDEFVIPEIDVGADSDEE